MKTVDGKTLGQLVFVDVMPSEQMGGGDDDEVVVALGIVVSAEVDLEGLGQYKDVPAQDRSAASERLAERILRGEVNLRAAAVSSRRSEIGRYGEQFFGTVPESVAVKQRRGIKVGTKKVGQTTADAMPWFAFGIALIGLAGAKWAKSTGQSQCTLALDLLPGSAGAAMELVRRLSHHPDLMQLWRQTKADTGVEIMVTNLGTFQPKGGPAQDARNHPGMILADWVAHSAYADANPVELLDHPAKRSPQYRDSIAAPVHALKERGWLMVVPTDGVVPNSHVPEAC